MQSISHNKYSIYTPTFASRQMKTGMANVNQVPWGCSDVHHGRVQRRGGERSMTKVEDFMKNKIPVEKRWINRTYVYKLSWRING